MEIKQYQAAMEAVLFASGEPVASGRLAEVLELDEETTVRLAEDLMQDINTRGGGLRMLRLDDRYQLCTNADYAGYVRKALEIRRNTPLSQAAMEVLAIVAYNQPVTRAFIEQVRGVDCGAVVQGLVQKSLIEEKGRLELPDVRFCMGPRRISCAPSALIPWRGCRPCRKKRKKMRRWRKRRWTT